MKQVLQRHGYASWWIIGTVSAVLAVAGIATGCASADSRPNVIVILADTLRADYLSAYGFDGDISPNLDALATESVLFENCIAQAPWTPPSIATLFTSLHPPNHCVGFSDGILCDEMENLDLEEWETEWMTLPPGPATLAEVFRKAGYDTTGFVGNWVVKTRFGYARGFETYFEPGGEKTHAESDESLLGSVVDWLKKRTDPRPFLLYVHLMDVHAPYIVTGEDFAAVHESPSLGDDRPLTAAEIQDRPIYLRARPRPDQPEMTDRLRNWRASYAAGVRHFDRQLGQFIEQVRSTGRLDDTILVFVSDHGEEILEHGAWEHGKTLHGTELNVPFLIRLPAGESGGTRVQRNVGLVDVMPTLIQLAGIEGTIPPMQGEDLSKLISDVESPVEAWTFATAVPNGPARIVAQNTKHKLIQGLSSDLLELYDLDADPQELTNIATEQPEIADSLKAVLKNHIETLRSFESYRPVQTPLTEEDIEALRSLGYVQ